MGKYMKSGEVGFCPGCGELVEVVVLPDDRLEARIQRAAAKFAAGGVEWTPEQILARQVTKLAVELGEAAARLVGVLPPPVYWSIMEAADYGKWHFDYGKWNRGVILGENVEDLYEELVDMQVVLVCAAGAVGEILEEEVDLMRDAVEKAEGDKGRRLENGDERRRTFSTGEEGQG